MLGFNKLKNKKEIFSNMKNLGYSVSNKNSKNDIRFIKKSENRIVILDTTDETFNLWEKDLFLTDSDLKYWFTGEDWFEEIINAFYIKQEDIEYDKTN